MSGRRVVVVAVAVAVMKNAMPPLAGGRSPIFGLHNPQPIQ